MNIYEMTADQLVALAANEAADRYPGDTMTDKVIRAAFERGMLQGFIKICMDELHELKKDQVNNEAEILNLQRQLIEKDN